MMEKTVKIWYCVWPCSCSAHFDWIRQLNVKYDINQTMCPRLSAHSTLKLNYYLTNNQASVVENCAKMKILILKMYKMLKHVVQTVFFLQERVNITVNRAALHANVWNIILASNIFAGVLIHWSSQSTSSLLVTTQWWMFCYANTTRVPTLQTYQHKNIQRIRKYISTLHWNVLFPPWLASQVLCRRLPVSEQLMCGGIKGNGGVI